MEESVFEFERKTTMQTDFPTFKLPASTTNLLWLTC